MQEDLTKTLPGDELDRAVALLDHYKSIHIHSGSSNRLLNPRIQSGPNA